jgi:ankyrin repeat protein
MNRDPQPTSATEIVGAIERATRDFKLCPNRIWAVAGSLPQREQNLPLLIPPPEKIKQKVDPKGHEDQKRHDQCTFDFCEYSRLDFTSVSQRHEPPCSEEKPCNRLQDRFDKDILKNAANAGNPTAWELDGKSMIEPPQPFMAISHVWSDGTGTGAWAEGEVNDCLYSFFRGIAEQFQCEGIWWDTICIPKEKAARSMAINKIQSNYEDARITLVHDCFLREWEWVDAETACFAIIMSPWFSRGWTSLELAKSRKVKVVFKGPLIKDLDEDILAKDDDYLPPFDPHQIATKAIANLRHRGITEINELLTVLGPRYTSWPRDIAIISGLLVGVEIPLHASQQDIYQRILKKIGKVSHEHLFHNSATMFKGFSWCPTSLLSMPLPPPTTSRLGMPPAPPTTPLRIKENGDVVGTWKVFDLDSIPDEKYVWKFTHPLIEAKLQSALLHKDRHMLLVEPEDKPITRAVLVKIMRNKEKALTNVHCEFVGSVYFHPPQEVGKENESWIKVVVRIGDREGMVEIEKKAWNYVCEVKRAIDSGQLNNLDDVETEEKEGQPPPKNGDGRISQNSDLLSAAANGDEVEVKRLMEKSDHNIQDKDKRTALHIAAEKGYIPVVKLLLNAGINIQDSMGQTALHLAAQNRHEAVVQLLLKKGADPDIQDKYTWTALHYATWRGYVQVAQELIRKTNQKLQDRLGQQALHLAAERGDEEIVKSLLRNGADPNVNCNDNQTALHRAAWGGSKMIVELLLSKIDDVDTKDNDGRTALHVSAGKGYLQVVILLLLKKAKPDVQDLKGRIALHLASQRGHKEVVELLMVKSNPDAPDKEERTALHLAAHNGHVEVVQLMKEKGANVEAKDKDGLTMLHTAVMAQQEPVVRLLVKNGADIKRQDHHGRTALHMAAGNAKQEAVVRLLVEEGAEIKVQDKDGLTVLHMAAMKHQEAVVRLLVEKGADVNVQDKDGRTALHLAFMEHQEAVVRLLVEMRADVNIQDKDGLTVLHMAAMKHQEAVVRLLVEMRAEVNVQDKDGRTALHVAVMEHQEAVVQLLVEMGADVNVQDIDGRTALHLTAFQQYKEQRDYKMIKQLLMEKDIHIELRDKYGQTALDWDTKSKLRSAYYLLVVPGAFVLLISSFARLPFWYSFPLVSISIILLLRLLAS